MNKSNIEKKEFLASLAVGDIFYTSWGYEQTNIDFYILKEVKGSKIQLQKVSSKTESTTGSMSRYVLPDPTCEIGSLISKIVRSRWVKIENAYLYKWNNQPLHETSYY